jgi:MoxR-like ATPase
MTTLASVLGDSITEYLSSRASLTDESVRILVVNYPEKVQKEAAAHLVNSHTRTSQNRLGIQTGSETVEFAVALIQSEEDARNGRLLVESGFPLGTSPDYPVKLRNDGGNAVVFCPPHLFESCHESIKANTFQRFERNSRFGGVPRIIGNYRANTSSEDADRYKYMVDEVIKLEREFNGDGRWGQMWEQAESSLSEEIVDLRRIGLLPSRRLIKESTAREIRQAVRANLGFQRELVDGLAQGQRGFLESKYGATKQFDELLAHTIAYNFQIGHQDPEWRESWPATLNIDDLVRSTNKPRLRIGSLNIDGSRSIQGLRVADDSAVDLSWTVSDQQENGDLGINLDGSELDVVEANQARFSFELPNNEVHKISLSSSEYRLTGTTEIYVVNPKNTGQIFAGVNNSVPGADNYQVGVGDQVSIRWWPLNIESLEKISVYSPPGSSPLDADPDPNDRLFELTDNETSVAIQDGLEESAEFTIQAEDGNSNLFETRFSINIGQTEIRTSKVGTIAKGILSALDSHSNPLSTDSVLDGQERTIVVEHAGEKFSAVIQDSTRSHSAEFLVEQNNLLDEAESDFLSNPECPWSRVAVRATAGGDSWDLSEPEADPSISLTQQNRTIYDNFVGKRKELFELLSQEAGVRRTQLANLSDQVEKYVSAYADLLEALAPDGGTVSDAGVSASLIDCVLIKEQGATNPSVILVSPTHPLRLAWLTQYENLVKSAIESGERLNPENYRSMDSSAFPSYLVDHEFRHFRAVGTSLEGSWLLLVGEKFSEFDKSLPIGTGKQIIPDSSLESLTVTPSQLASGILRYHELHPYKDILRIAYIGAGSAEQIREAIQIIFRGNEPSGLLGHTRRRLRIEIDLLDVSESNDQLDLSTGAAFYRDLDSDKSQDLLDRVTFTIRHMLLGDFIENIDGESKRYHLLFGSEIFGREGRSDPAVGTAQPLCDGLVLRTLRSWRLRDPLEFSLQTQVSRPDDADSMPGGLQRTAFRLQSIAAAESGRRSVATEESRRIVVSLSAAKREALTKMHLLSEWVYLMDANVDVEFFDSPSMDENYVLDYLPRIVAESRASRVHNYLISSENDKLVNQAINTFVHSAYVQPEQASHYRNSAVLLRKSLNDVSGRQLFKLVGEPSAAKGAVGTAFCDLLYKSATTLSDHFDEESGSMVLLIAVDDYFDNWKRDCILSDFPVSGKKADLLAVGVTLNDGELRLSPTVIEIKNRRENYRRVDLIATDGPVAQILNTVKVVEFSLGLGQDIPRADRSLKNFQLAELLDHHIRRKLMQLYGHSIDDYEQVQKFRGTVYRAVSTGNFGTAWPRRSESDFQGSVVHFNAIRGDQGSVGEIFDSNSESFTAYIPIGLSGIQSLLRDEPVAGIEQFAGWLDPRSEPPPSPPDVDSEEDPDPGAQPPQPTLGTPSQSVAPILDSARGAFRGFIGNEAPINRLVPWLATAMQEQPPRLPENIAFTGPASTGKTELSKRVASALDLPRIELVGSTVSSIDNLFDRMEREIESQGLITRQIGTEGGLPIILFPPMIVFIDEAHELRRSVQEALLPLLEPQTRRSAGTKIVADIRDCTILFATTDWGDLIGTLQTRFQRISLQPYTADQVSQIVNQEYQEWDEDTCKGIAIAGRLVPRQALQKASEFENSLTLFTTQSTTEILNYYYGLWGINPEGLTAVDLKYLRILEDSAGPVGATRLANQLEVGDRELTRNIEPFLQQLGMIEISTRGRNLSLRGAEYARAMSS